MNAHNPRAGILPFPRANFLSSKIRASIRFALGSILIAFVALASACASDYRNVTPDLKLSQVKTEMTEKQVTQIMGPPNDISQSERTGVKLAWYPLTLLIIPAFYHPPYSDEVYFYKGEGRVLFRSGWAGDINMRVIGVEGDTNEDGYR